MHISGRIGDHNEVPVPEGIQPGAVIRNADADVKDLCKGAQVIPVIIGLPCQDTTAGHGAVSRIGVPGNAAAGQKYTQVIGCSFADIDVIFRSVRCLTASHRHAVPLVRLGFYLSL